jgi:hypothetical protein
MTPGPPRPSDDSAPTTALDAMVADIDDPYPGLRESELLAPRSDSDRDRDEEALDGEILAGLVSF